MRPSFFSLLAFIVIFYFNPHVFASDINEIVYPPPEPERMTDDQKDGSSSEKSDESELSGKKKGIREEVHDRDKMNKVYVYPDGRVLVPGTTPFEPVEDVKRREKNSSGTHDSHYDHHHHHHKEKQVHQVEPELSEKKGRVKSKLGITGPGHVFVPAKESSGFSK